MSYYHNYFEEHFDPYHASREIEFARAWEQFFNKEMARQYQYYLDEASAISCCLASMHETALADEYRVYKDTVFI